MAWIESHTLLIRHRKLVALAKSLRLKPVYCLGHLHALWHAAMEQAEDGDLSSWTDEFIAESAGFQGDAPQFVSLLQLHGWLDGKMIHDWIDYAGRFLRGKYSTRERSKLVDIWAKYGKTYGNADKLPTDCRQVADKLPTCTKPNLTVPNPTKPKNIAVGSSSGDCKVIASVGGGTGEGKVNVNGNDVDQNLQTQDLLDRIVEFTDSRDSRAFYQKAIRVLGCGLVEEAMGEVRMRDPDSRARYLTAILQDWMRGRAPA